MSGFTKGSKKPPGSGIQKGQKQKGTLIRRRVEEVLMTKGVDLVEMLLHEIAQIEKPEAKANIILKLMEYVHPKLSAQSVTVDDKREEDTQVIDVTPMTTDELLTQAKGDEE